MKTYQYVTNLWNETEMLMAEKTAGVWLGATALGGPTFLSSKQVTRIAGRPDEAWRRKALKIG